MTLPEDEAAARVSKQGLGSPRQFGPNAPTSLKALQTALNAHARRGYSLIQDGYAPGMSSMAAPVRRKGEPTTGVLVIAGPSARLTAKAMARFGPDLMAAADELALAGQASPLLKSANVGTWGNRTDDDRY
jgi:IclR family transcriptional regulator, acetate operon repressor